VACIILINSVDILYQSKTRHHMTTTEPWVQSTILNETPHILFISTYRVVDHRKFNKMLQTFQFL